MAQRNSAQCDFRHGVNCNKSQVVADRVVIGTDHPFDMTPLDVPASVDGIPGLTADEKAWLCERTAKLLLGEK